MDANLSRRNFLKNSGSMTGIAWLKLNSPAVLALTASACSAREAASSWHALDDVEAADLAAIAARLIPTTDTPGATEAGVIHFIDLAFSEALKEQLEGTRAGLSEFNQALADTHPGVEALSDLEPAAQDAFLSTREGTDFFELLRVMTIYGFFGMEKYGGNDNHVGWELIDFKGHHGAWTHPFGFYDAQANGGSNGG